MHSLLERQIKRAKRADGSLDLERLLLAVESAYRDNDRNRTVADHSLQVLQRDLEILNRTSLEDAEARISAIMDNVGEAVIVMDSGYHIQNVNETARKMFGYDRGELRGVEFALLMAADTNGTPYVAEPGKIADAMKGQSVHLITEVRARRKDGSDFPAELSVSEMVLRRSGLQFVAIIRDVTDRKAAEERARQAERQLLDAIEAIGDAFALYDHDDRLVICNTQYSRLFEFGSFSSIIGMTFHEIINSAEVANLFGYEEKKMREVISRRIAEHDNPTGTPQLFALRNGRWLIAKEFRTRDGGVVGIRTDITELKRREAEIEALKQRYELILGSAGDGIIGVNANRVVTFANQAACRMLGVEANSMEGRDFASVMPGLEETCGLDTLPAQFIGEDVRETTFTRADGTTFVGEYVRAPLRKGMEIEGLVVVFRDISLRKHYEEGIANHQRVLEQQVAERTEKLSAEIKRRALTEQALMRSQGRLSGITSNLVEAVLLVDHYGHILFANRSAHRFLQAEAGQLPGTEVDDTVRLLVDGQVVEFLRGPWPEVIQKGETIVDNDAVFVLPDGKRLFVAYACSPLEEDGKRRAAIISFRSIEALKEAQRESLQASRLASVGQLAAGIAHEINTPIQYIGDNLRFLDESLLAVGQAFTGIEKLVEESGAGNELSKKLTDLFEEKEISYLLEEMPTATRQSLEGVQHVAHIVRSMKDFSHPGTTAKVATDLNRAIDSVLTVSRNVWKQVAEVKTDLDPNLPSVICFPADINQVLLNLIVNAAHALESPDQPKPGQISISTHLDGKTAEIRISDNGPGVPADIRDRIFDPFFTTKPVGKGTGQGLAICFDVIVNKHGGKIYLDESAQGGATFVTRLPTGESDA